MKKTSFIIAGKHAVIEAIKNKNRKVIKVYFTENTEKELNRENQPNNIFSKTTCIYKNKRELDNLCGRDDTNHQGIVAEIEPLDSLSIKEFVEKNKKQQLNFIALDNVTDPRNIGSVLRSSAAFSIDGIIVNERTFPAKSKLMYKSASGAIEHINIFLVSNINTTLKYLKTKDFWVTAFDSSAKDDFTKHEWSKKNILVFGSEGFGIKKHTLKYADFKLNIKINKNIESLNISNSVAVVCHFLTKNLY